MAAEAGGRESVPATLEALNGTLKAIREQFIPYSWDLRAAASLGRPILQELLQDVEGLVSAKQDVVERTQQAVQDAKVEAEHLKDDRIREAVLRERGVAPDSARQYMAELQASVKQKMEERNKAWAQVMNLSELRNIIKRAIEASAYAPDPVTFEVAKMKQQYMTLYYQRELLRARQRLDHACETLSQVDQKYIKTVSCGTTDEFETAGGEDGAGATAGGPQGDDDEPRPTVLPMPPSLPLPLQTRIDRADKDDLLQLLDEYDRYEVDLAAIHLLQESLAMHSKGSASSLQSVAGTDLMALADSLLEEAEHRNATAQWARQLRKYPILQTTDLQLELHGLKAHIQSGAGTVEAPVGAIT